MDLIYRQASLDAINKCTDIYVGNLPAMIDKAEAYKALSKLPSAQQDIIRCKDCKYNSNPAEYGNACCDTFYGMTDQMGFCYMAERRENSEQ